MSDPMRRLSSLRFTSTVLVSALFLCFFSLPATATFSETMLPGQDGAGSSISSRAISPAGAKSVPDCASKAQKVLENAARPPFTPGYTGVSLRSPLEEGWGVCFSQGRGRRPEPPSNGIPKRQLEQLRFSASEVGVSVPASRPSGEQGTIVAFGDSLTQGFVLPEAEAYPAQLERKLRAEGFDYRVINAGINGETSSGALSRVNWILRMKPDIVILETGANDGFRGIKPEHIEKNISEIIRILKENDVTVVLAGMRMLSNLGAEYTAAFRDIYPRVARMHGVILVPFFLEGVAGEPSMNLPDGIHPTAKGHGILVKNVWPYVLEAIGKNKGAWE